ncbi:hypothetical protein BDZ94DRAFT_1170906, partial [Collybia nuda]
IRRWGKYRLPNNRVLQSQISYKFAGEPSRRYCWFLAIDKASGKQVFGKALAFYEVLSDGASDLYVAYQELTDVETVLGTIHGKSWSDATQVLPTSNIIDIVGIWDETSNIYIIQKH